MLGYNVQFPGGWSQRMWAPTEQFIPVPEGMPDERAVLTVPGAAVLAEIRKVDWSLASTVLVIGSGARGLLAMAFLAALYSGVATLAVARPGVQHQAVVAMGARYVTHHPAQERDFLRVAGRRFSTPGVLFRTMRRDLT